MFWLGLFLASSASAKSRDLSDEGVRPPRDSRLHLPPIRLETRAAIREGMGAAAVLELGVQVARTERNALDVNFAVGAPRGIREPGPFRSWGSFDFSADYALGLSRWMSVAPAAGVSLRSYRQQGQHIDTGFVPFVGARSETAILRARRWSMMIEFGVAVDLSPTRFVLETAQVVNLNPIEGQFGLRWNFGHGRPPADGDRR